MDFLLLIGYMAVLLWLGSRILEKAGFQGKMVFCLLIPYVNLIIIWYFAFTKWPNLKSDVKQDM